MAYYYKCDYCDKSVNVGQECPCRHESEQDSTAHELPDEPVLFSCEVDDETARRLISEIAKKAERRKAIESAAIT